MALESGPLRAPGGTLEMQVWGKWSAWDGILPLPVASLQPSLSPASSPVHHSDGCEVKNVCEGLSMMPEGARAWSCCLGAWV